MLRGRSIAMTYAYTEEALKFFDSDEERLLRCVGNRSRIASIGTGDVLRCPGIMLARLRFQARVPTAQVAHNGVEPADERMLLVGVADTSCPKGPYAGHASIRGPRNPVTAFAKVRFLDVAVRQLRASRQFPKNLAVRNSAWWTLQDSTRQPDRYERAALISELQAAPMQIDPWMKTGPNGRLGVANAPGRPARTMAGGRGRRER